MALHEVPIQIDEVPRDTWQSAEWIDTAVKQEFIEHVWKARKDPSHNFVIEATAFVSPNHFPQHKDAAELIRRLSPPSGVTLSVLIPNIRGFDDAMVADDGRRAIGEIAVFTAATESFLRHNMGMSIGVIKFEGKALPSNTASDVLANTFQQLGYDVNVDPDALVEAAYYLHQWTGMPIYSGHALRKLGLKTGSL